MCCCKGEIEEGECNSEEGEVAASRGWLAQHGTLMWTPFVEEGCCGGKPTADTTRVDVNRGWSASEIGEPTITS